MLLNHETPRSIQLSHKLFTIFQRAYVYMYLLPIYRVIKLENGLTALLISDLNSMKDDEGKESEEENGKTFLLSIVEAIILNLSNSLHFILKHPFASPMMRVKLVREVVTLMKMTAKMIFRMTKTVSTASALNHLKEIKKWYYYYMLLKYFLFT
jgi:hypothetical protein